MIVLATMAVLDAIFCCVARLVVERSVYKALQMMRLLPATLPHLCTLCTKIYYLHNCHGCVSKFLKQQYSDYFRYSGDPDDYRSFLLAFPIETQFKLLLACSLVVGLFN